MWRPDPADPWWVGDRLALTGTEAGGNFTTRGPIVIAADDLVAGAASQPLDAQWRAILDVAGFTPGNVDEVAALAASAQDRVNAALPFSNRAQVLTKLPTILAAVDRSVLVAQSGILLLLVQFGVLAAYAIVLVAALLLERRRTETALLRARGGGFGHLLSMSAGEALLITVPAVIAAPWLASLLVLAVRLNPALEGVGLEAPLPGPATFAVAVIGGTRGARRADDPDGRDSTVNISGVRAAVGRQVGRTLPQRLGLDLVLVLVAVIALAQLRLYGAPITRNARGALGVDPLLVAAPAIGLLAGAVIAIRLVPRLAELAERLLARGRGLVPALAGRQIARRPLRYTRAALLLILAAALGTFASAHAATWTRSQGDQAAYAAGADVRLGPGPRSAIPAVDLGGALRAVPGVTAATPVVRAAIQLGTTLRRWPLVGIDGAAMADIVRLRDDETGRGDACGAPCARRGTGAVARTRDPRGDATPLADRGLGGHARRRASNPSRPATRASTSRSSCSTQMAGSPGSRVARRSSAQTASGSRSTWPGPTVPGCPCLRRSPRSSSASRTAARATWSPTGTWTSRGSPRAPTRQGTRGPRSRSRGDAAG